MKAVKRPPVIKSQPYRPQGKGLIEGFFGNFERFFLSDLAGYVGGDRMRKPTANLGQAPMPFPGTMADLQREIDARLALYHEKPRSGATLNGVSPNDRFRAHAAADWQSVTAEREALEAAFVTVETRTNQGGYLSLLNADFVSDALASRPDLERVTVHVPIVGNRDRVWLSTTAKTSSASRFARRPSR